MADETARHRQRAQCCNRLQVRYENPLRASSVCNSIAAWFQAALEMYATLSSTLAPEGRAMSQSSRHYRVDADPGEPEKRVESRRGAVGVG
jgi:hypothetical protein